MPHLDDVEHHWTDVGDDVWLHWASAGDPEAPPLVLVHGWPQHWYAWRHQITALAGERRVIAVDLRGHGWSDAPPGDYRKAGLASDLLGLLDRLELEQVDLAGHDWGGWTSLLLTLDNPERVRRLVLASIGLPWTKPTPSTLKHLWRFWYQWAVATPVVGELGMRAGLVRHILPMWSGVQLEADALDSYADVLRQPARARMSSQMYRTFTLRELPEVIANGHRDRVLDHRALLLFGREDTPLHPDLIGLGDPALETHAPNLEVELLDANHFVLEECHEVVTERLRTFLGDWPTP